MYACQLADFSELSGVKFAVTEYRKKEQRLGGHNGAVCATDQPS
jgi:hypothetical protein